MELSEEVQDLMQKFKLLVKRSEDSIGSSGDTPKFMKQEVVFNPEDLIDLTGIDFSNGEEWLCVSPKEKSDIPDLQNWLYEDCDNAKDLEFHSHHLSLIRELAQIDNTKKSIDSRTFTRPKKRISRPSIETYNEGYFNISKKDSSADSKVDDDFPNYISPLEINESVGKIADSITKLSVLSFNSPEKFNKTSDVAQNTSVLPILLSSTDSDQNTTYQKPLSFDLSQPTTSSIFEKIVASAPELDSFQNMSPPSLVNSMCSSTFTNLMDSSFIKNDPVLREIRDTDYTEAILLESSDSPFLMNSFTESCCSLNSDTPESFLRKTLKSSFSGTFKRNSSKDKENVRLLNETYEANDPSLLNCTYQRDSIEDEEVTSDSATTGNQTNRTILHQQTMNNIQPKNTDLNGTIIINTSPLQLNGTFRKSPSAKLNQTFQKVPIEYNDATINNIKHDEFNNCSVTINNITDSNLTSDQKRRNSYIIEDNTSPVILKRNSFGYLTGSADSLDEVSSLSNSSKGSSRVLNMAEVDAIVLQQERSLDQVMSTPRPQSKSMTRLWDSNCISPIMQNNQDGPLSDSETTSTSDDYMTVRSSMSKPPSLGSDTNLRFTKNNLKSLENLTLKSNPRSLNVIASKPKELLFERKMIAPGTNTKSSHSLKNVGGATNIVSCSNLRTIGSNLKGSYSNLKTMNSNLKGSYTSLKPVLTNLLSANVTAKPSATVSTRDVTFVADNVKPKVAEVAPTRREFVVPGQVKPASAPAPNLAKIQPKPSGLPRPLTGIPRPVSRIPGPCALRPVHPRPLTRPGSQNIDGYF